MNKINRETFIQLLKLYSDQKREWIMWEMIKIDLQINPKSILTRYSKKAVNPDFFGVVVVKGDVKF